MKALSIHQPWASLIVSGRRKWEIRKWNTRFRGLLLIHAGRTLELPQAQRFGMADTPWMMLLGQVDLVNVKRITEEEWERARELHLELGPRPYGDKTFAWIMINPVKLRDAIPMRGRLGIFDVSDDLLPKGWWR